MCDIRQLLEPVAERTSATAIYTGSASHAGEFCFMYMHVCILMTSIVYICLFIYLFLIICLFIFIYLFIHSFIVLLILLYNFQNHFHSIDKVSEVDAVALFLQFVPLEGEVLDFFHPITGQILNLIRGKKCLPTEPYSQKAVATATFSSLASSSDQMAISGSDMSGAVDWKQPAQCLYVRDDFVHDHISQELLVESLDLYYLHPSVLDSLNPSLQNQLGIKSLQMDHLKEVARVLLEKYHHRYEDDVKEEESDDDDDLMITEDDSEDDEDDDVQIVGVTRASGKSAEDSRSVMVEWIAGWLACVHIVMEETGSLARTDLLDKIKDLEILPLEDGRFISANEEGAIFFPPDCKGDIFIFNSELVSD